MTEKTTDTNDNFVTLIDGTKIKTAPLKISLLRPFMTKFQGIADVSEDNEKSMTVLLECVQIALKQYKPEIADDLSALEDNIDLPTVYKIIEAASGSGISGVGTIQA